VTAHGAALVVSLLLPLELPFQLLLCAAIGVSLIQAARLHVWRSSQRAVAAVDAVQDQHWILHLRSGEEFQGQLLSSSFVHPRLLILNFSTAPLQGRSLVLAADAVDPDLLRQLRVRLRLMRSLG